MNKTQLLMLSLVLTTLSHFDTVYAQTKEEKDLIKKQLKSMSVEDRTDAISRAEVVNSKIDSIHRTNPAAISQINMFNELNQQCGQITSYNPKGFTGLDWPKVTCKYIQDNKSLGGANKKFYCEFNEIGKDGQAKAKKRKVKYSTTFQMPWSELPATIIASTATRLIGFHTESYCPAVVKCDNCPSDNPWEQDRSSAPPSNNSYKFNTSIIEKPADLDKIALPTSGDFNWDEMRSVVDTPEKSAREKLIEREALLLWVNFLADTDALPFNQRISCEEASLNGNQVRCDKPIIYDHDYGHAFYYRFKFDKWSSHTPLFESNNGTCRGGLTNSLLKSARGDGQIGAHVSPVISAEARDFLVSRLRRITLKQWSDMARIANINFHYRIDEDDFAKVVISKIESMAQVRCAPFDTHTSVLAPK